MSRPPSRGSISRASLSAPSIRVSLTQTIPKWTAEYNEIAAATINFESKLAQGYTPTGDFCADYVHYCTMFKIPQHPSINTARVKTQVTKTDEGGFIALRNFIIDSATVKILIKVLTHAQGVVGLEFHNAGIRQDNLEKIIALLPSTGISHFTLSYIDISNIKSLVPLLGETSALRSLSLRGIFNLSEGIGPLAEALEMNTRLCCFDVFDCRVGDAGALMICEALRFNTVLNGLSLSKNNLTQTGALAVGDLLTGGAEIVVGGALEKKMQAAEARIISLNKTLAVRRKKIPDLQPVPSLPVPVTPGKVAGKHSLFAVSISDNPDIGAAGISTLLENLAAVPHGSLGLRALHLQRTGVSSLIGQESFDTLLKTAKDSTGAQIHV